MSNMDEIDKFSVIVEEIGYEAEPMKSPVKEPPQKSLNFSPASSLDQKEKGEDMRTAHKNHNGGTIYSIDGITPNNTEMIDQDGDGVADGVYKGKKEARKENRLERKLTEGFYGECFENALWNPWSIQEKREEDEEFSEDKDPSGVTSKSKKGVAELRNGYNGGKKNGRDGYNNKSIHKRPYVPGGPDDRSNNKKDRSSITGNQSSSI